jgi:hypothetical protein
MIIVIIVFFNFLLFLILILLITIKIILFRIQIIIFIILIIILNLPDQSFYNNIFFWKNVTIIIMVIVKKFQDAISIYFFKNNF